MNSGITFALYFGNRGFFPSESIARARAEMIKAVTDAGCGYICLEEDKTAYGAVETVAEGRIYAEFLERNRGKYQGVIICLPNFGDENGAQAALKDVRVPILVQAYPDMMDEMDFAHRRDAMCGKFAMCNVLLQMQLPFTLTTRFTVSPSDKSFAEDLRSFAAVCRVVDGMKCFNIGAIGARTTAFKTVRVDEYALQKKGINVEAIDLSTVFERINKVKTEDIQGILHDIDSITVFEGFPQEKLITMAKLQAVILDIVREYDLQAVAIRCWSEFQTVLGIAPCTSLCLLNSMGIQAACEVDITNAAMMRALALASGSPCTLLDFNNNYGDAEDKAIMFHCGPVPAEMLEGKGRIIEHPMFRKTYGPGSGVGVNKGKLRSGDVTFGSLKTRDGKIGAFVAEGSFTSDPIPEEFFGTGKVIQTANLDRIERHMAENGYKHHVCVSFGKCGKILREAFEKYLGFETAEF